MIFDKTEGKDEINTTVRQIGDEIVMDSPRKGQYIIAEPAAVINVGDME